MAKEKDMDTDDVNIEQGSGNIFADLGRSDSDAHQLKADLVMRIDDIVRSRGLSQVQAGELMGLSQPDVSRLLRGNFRDYSMERLMRLLTMLGRDVDIVIRKPTSPRQGRLSIDAA